MKFNPFKLVQWQVIVDPTKHTFDPRVEQLRETEAGELRALEDGELRQVES